MDSLPNQIPDQSFEDESIQYFWYRTFFTGLVVILAALLFCCCNRRRRGTNANSERVTKDAKMESKSNGSYSNGNTVQNGTMATGDHETASDQHHPQQPLSTKQQQQYSSGSEDESYQKRAPTIKPVATSEDSGSSSEMEILGSRHRTTIEIKRFKTAVLPSKRRVTNGEADDDQSVMTSRWNGVMNGQQHNDHGVVQGELTYEKSNLVENGHHIEFIDCAAEDGPEGHRGASAGHSGGHLKHQDDDSEDYNIVQVTVNQQTLDSFHIVPSKEEDEERQDQVEEIVTWRKRDESTAAPPDHRNSAEKRSSVLDVIGAKDVEEVLEKMETLESVTDVIRLAGLEQSQLIFGIDYTASNQHQGKISFDGDSLHCIRTDRQNPYQQVINIMGRTLAPLARGGYIPAYGFGDIRTSDTSIFSLKPNGHCSSFDEVLKVYNQITPKIILAGPTNFAPLIYQAIDVCKEFRRYHILVIVADGQVTNEPDTRKAIVEACDYPLSIIVVGVGDGPWDMMRVFDEKLPKRSWDNFHFIDFYKVTRGAKNPELTFAVQALFEIPDQYQQIKALGLLDDQD